ncbi:MAG: S24/S26 family peptidase [Candidatus Omnitrophica bacterium]|nr:S24/S26 family peptidase [Candidatus Omnitrophota bacterium]
MKLKENNSLYFVARAEELTLSATALSALMQAALAKEAFFRFKAKGFSMQPFIKDGDIVTVSPANGAALGRGQTVAFIRPGGKLVIHRIVACLENGYLIKGDSCFTNDGLVKKEDILGYVSEVKRNDRAIFLGLGRERVAIAVLSRIKILPCILWCWRLIPRRLRKKIVP